MAHLLTLLLLVPVPGDVMPSGREKEMYGGNVRIVVHPMIQAKGKDADKVCRRCPSLTSCIQPFQLSRTVMMFHGNAGCYRP